MARIAGVNIPTQKRVIISLQYIAGIGAANAAQICAALNIDAARRVNQLSDAEVLAMREYIDANGILHVGAKDKGTGKENKITIKANSGLSEAEIQQMVKDAELNAAEDKKKLEIVQARNQGDALVHSTKKSLTEYGDKLEAGEKEKIEAAIKDLEEALKGDDKSAIDAKTEALMTASQKLGEKMYADMQAQQAAGAAGGEQTKPADDDVVDAEVKEVKKD